MPGVRYLSKIDERLGDAIYHVSFKGVSALPKKLNERVDFIPRGRISEEIKAYALGTMHVIVER